MGALVGLLFSLAVVAVALGGVATIAGHAQLRDRCFSLAIGAALLAVLLPIVVQLLTKSFQESQGGSTVAAASFSPIALAVFLVGHASLGVALLRQRTSGGSRVNDLEQARGRPRPRLSPEGEEQ